MRHLEIMGYPAEILEALDAITFHDHKTHDEFVLRLKTASGVKGELSPKYRESNAGAEKLPSSGEPK